MQIIYADIILKEMKKDGDKGLMTFLWPADVKGTKMLTWAHKDQNDDQWIYLPALKRVKRITSSSKTGSFMGSEFSYEDLGSQEVEKYTYKLLKETTYKKRKVWILERVPKDKDSGYSRQVVWIDKKYMGPVRIEYFDRKNEKLKTAVFTKFKKIKRWWRSLNVEIENHQTKKKSIMIWKNLKLGVNLNPRDFDKDNLK